MQVPRLSIAVADDHPVYLAGLESLLSGTPEWTLRIKAKSSTELVTGLSNHPVQVVLTDVTMPGGRFGDGLSLLGFIKRRFGHVRLIVLTSVTNETVLRSIMDLGAHGIVSKADPLDCVVDALNAVMHKRERYLSPSIAALMSKAPEADVSLALTRRESEVLRLFVQGLSVAQIAAMIARSSKTVSTQKISAMRKLGVSTDAELFAYAARSGLTSSSSQTRDDAGAS